MNGNSYFLGVDGGGSKTTAVVFNENGEFICSACGESINYYSVGLEAARIAMKNITENLCIKKFRCAVIGMSALNERASVQETERFCAGIIDSENIIMDSDLFVALEAMDISGECAAIISGTGSMAVCRNDDGSMSHTGGWGYILGDEGSGYSIGLAGIKAAIRAYEKCAPDTAIFNECLEYFSVNNIYDLIDLYYEKKVSRKKTAAFARLVSKCCENGDEVARNILINEAEELSKTALGLLRDKSKDIAIGLWGGVFQNNMFFRHEFTDIMNRHGFENVKLIDFTPEIGAIFAGYKNSGIEIVDIIKENIKTTYINTLV